MAAEGDVEQLGNGECVQGLYEQPRGGPFAVFVFCDDALSTNIGVVNVAGAAGPGGIELSDPRVWDKWFVTDRFWQESSWAADVTSFAWSDDLKFLYVATSGVYGTGSLYRLSLVERSSAHILTDSRKDESQDHARDVRITRMDEEAGEVVVEVDYVDQGGEAKRVLDRVEMK